MVVAESYGGEACDVLVALHAKKSAAAVWRAREERPELPVVVALTGTDLYRDLGEDPGVAEVLRTADRIVALQPRALEALPADLRARVRVVPQSAVRLRDRETPQEDAGDRFEVCVLAHLRDEKDPLRAAHAARLLPETSRLLVVHAGAVLDESLGAQAREEALDNPRYRWIGELRRVEARRLLARSRLLVVSSRMEGGANVVTEALAEGVPVVHTRVDGAVGILGADYPGYFEVGDTAGLAALLHAAETDPGFHGRLQSACAAVAGFAEPEREGHAWGELLGELAVEGPCSRTA